MDNVELVRRVYAAFAAGDVPGVLAAFDANIEWYLAEHNPYWPGKALVGPQAVVEGVFVRLLEDFDGFQVNVQRLVGCGETVLVEARYGGTAKATGEPLDLQVAHVWDVRDGKVVRWQQYCDTWELVRVMGLSPAQAP